MVRLVQSVCEAGSGESWASHCLSLAQAKAETEVSRNPKARQDPVLSFLRTLHASELNTLAFQVSLRQACEVQVGHSLGTASGIPICSPEQGETFGRAVRFKSPSLQLQLMGRSPELGGQYTAVPILTWPLASWLTSASQ